MLPACVNNKNSNITTAKSLSASTIASICVVGQAICIDYNADFTDSRLETKTDKKRVR